MGTVMQHDDAWVQSLVDEIEAYLRANPLACDSAEGIARWWLKNGDVVASAALESALLVLQLRQLIEPVTSIDGRTRYRCRAPHPSSPTPSDRGDST